MSKHGAPAAPRAALELAPAGRGWGPIRRKGHIGPASLVVLAVLASLPLVLVFCRLLALPGESIPLFGLGPLRALGEVLDQWLTLDWIPPSDRGSILYLLLLPTGALLVAFTRLTLGVRVLGFRAILIAIGFKASGFVPSLSLLLVVSATILVIRPWIRRIRLPMFARVAVILCLSATIMIGALLVAPWLHSDAVWGVAFFPVIIMAMMAEGIAKTMEQDNAVTAVWRAGWTVGLAVVILAVDLVLAPIILQFPELILTELIAILFVAEFLDLRLLEEGPERLSRLVPWARPQSKFKPRIAVVRNQESPGVVGRLGTPAPAKYRKLSVQRPVDALRDQGFKVKVLEGDMTLLRALADFLPPDPRRGTPGGIVLNLATGVQGEGRLSHVPAMLEMAGIPYTGPGPVALSRLADRHALLTLLEQASVPVPRWQVITDPGETMDLEFPVSVRPRFEPDAARIVVRNRKTLRAAVREIRRHYAQPTMVEQVVRGRRIHASLLGNGSIECLPLVESGETEGSKTCPAPIDDVHAERLRETARKAYEAAGCRDYARIDVRLSTFGEPVVVEIRWVDIFERRGAFVTAAAAAGYAFPMLMRRIVDEAAKRYLAAAVARKALPAIENGSTVVPIAERRVAAE
jgi:D-alanine-D-alanine ligase